MRWYFSRGSHVFPQAAVVSGAGFCYLAYHALPTRSSLVSLLNPGSNGRVVNGYLLAAALVMSIAPITGIMVRISLPISQHAT